MTRQEQLKVDFYRTSAVHNVLKRYEFTDKEKGIIQAAILTAKKKQPNMKLIDDADALLKEIASTRTPLKQEVDTIELARGKAGVAMVNSKSKAYTDSVEEKRFRNIIIANVVIVVLLYGTLRIFYPDFILPSQNAEPTLKTFAEAQAYCQEQGKVLPLTFEDAPLKLDIPNEYNKEGYWRANGGVIYNQFSAYQNTDKSDGKKHYALCVKENGKEHPMKYNSLP